MVSMHLLVLSAFRPGIRQPVVDHSGVSMHLLVLSAFRHDLMNAAGPEFRKFQCTFWCSVLSDIVVPYAKARGEEVFQCTFWCSVLSDRQADRLDGPQH